MNKLIETRDVAVICECPASDISVMAKYLGIRPAKISAVYGRPGGHTAWWRPVDVDMIVKINSLRRRMNRYEAFKKIAQLEIVSGKKIDELIKSYEKEKQTDYTPDERLLYK